MDTRSIIRKTLPQSLRSIPDYYFEIGETIILFSLIVGVSTFACWLGYRDDNYYYSSVITEGSTTYDLTCEEADAVRVDTKGKGMVTHDDTISQNDVSVSFKKGGKHYDISSVSISSRYVKQKDRASIPCN